MSGYDIPIVDCIIGGSPCQDLSVAGICAIAMECCKTRGTFDFGPLGRYNR